MSHTMLGFAWSQRNGGKGPWSMGMRRAAAPSQAAPEAAHQKV